MPINGAFENQPFFVPSPDLSGMGYEKVISNWGTNPMKIHLREI